MQEINELREKMASSEKDRERLSKQNEDIEDQRSKLEITLQTEKSTMEQLIESEIVHSLNIEPERPQV